MAVNSVAAVGISHYTSVYKRSPLGSAAWDAQMEQVRHDTESRTGLGLDELEANSAAAQARVIAAQADNISSMPLQERLAMIREEGKQVDRTNMSDKEIMEEIYARFKKYLPNEGEWPLVDCGYNFPGKTDIAMAYVDEQNELRKMGWTLEREVNAYSEMMGYGGMSYDEKREAIVKKYADAPMTTYRTIQMIEEMGSAGVAGDLARLTLRLHFNLEDQVEATFYKQGYSYHDLHDENYYQRTIEKYKELYNEPIGFSGVWDNLVYIKTSGGKMSPKEQNGMSELLELMQKSGLLP